MDTHLSQQAAGHYQTDFQPKQVVTRSKGKVSACVVKKSKEVASL